MKYNMKGTWRLVKTVATPFQKFIQSEQSAGIVLVITTIVSLVLANSSWQNAYISFWENNLAISIADLHLSFSFTGWINDALMALFFLLVGIELKKEFIQGELAEKKNAVLPFLLALGGMVMPALLYTLFNLHTPTANGWGVPMATDIAFALTIFRLLGNKVSYSLKILLTALAVIDDLGAIVVIALFYTSQLSIYYLLISILWTIIGIVLSYYKIRFTSLYLLLGILLWYTLHAAGIHPTIAGVAIGFLLPINQGNKVGDALHYTVPYFILPLFIAANTALSLDLSLDFVTLPNIGIFVGLVIGKPVGIILAAWCAKITKIATLPSTVNMHDIVGLGLTAGIGFTVSIFVASLSYIQIPILNGAKLSIMLASLLASMLGYAYLSFLYTKNNPK